MAAALVLLLDHNAGRGAARTAFITDASLLGYAVLESAVTAAELGGFVCRKERWRFDCESERRAGR